MQTSLTNLEVREKKREGEESRDFSVMVLLAVWCDEEIEIDRSKISLSLSFSLESNIFLSIFLFLFSHFRMNWPTFEKICQLPKYGKNECL